MRNRVKGVFEGLGKSLGEIAYSKYTESGDVDLDVKMNVELTREISDYLFSFISENEEQLKKVVESSLEIVVKLQEIESEFKPPKTRFQQKMEEMKRLSEELNKNK